MTAKDNSDLIEDDPYVFISYASPDIEVAEKVEDFLASAGFRVFRDRKDIHSGHNIYKAINRALTECDRIVLLQSPASMPEAPEVFKEWMLFDIDNKPIHPLYLQDCDLFGRLRLIKYIDARTDLQGALETLAGDLRRKVDLMGQMTKEQVAEIQEHKPRDLEEYRLGRIAEWSLPQFQLDKRFVNLTLLLDKGENEPQRWFRPEDSRFDDLREVLKSTKDNPALVLLGAPGCGKSTLLRRLQLDHCRDCQRDGSGHVSFFVQLNRFRSDTAEPRMWLNEQWNSLYPELPGLETYLKDGRALLLLDAINEMPHRDGKEYRRLVGMWREFTEVEAGKGNRIVFSCRSLDYSAPLSSKDLRIPQIEVQPLTDDQMQGFVKSYAPQRGSYIWDKLNGSPQQSIFRTPYFLKLLCEQVVSSGEMPEGRAGLFTGLVRQALSREINSDILDIDDLLDEMDRNKIAMGSWRDQFELPVRGILIRKLSDLAFKMQEKGIETEGAQVRIDYDVACALVDNRFDKDVFKAGVALSVLDIDLRRNDLAFFHQLLQEYFAARRLAKEPNSDLVHVEYIADKVSPTLNETIDGLADGDPLPPLSQTGWEETTLTAAPMAKDPESFIRDMIPHNLPLAARCSTSPEVNISDDLKTEIQNLLITQTQDMKVDLRARIAVGEALGTIGDPRFERRTGPYGDFLVPPLVDIAGGIYPIGDDKSEYDREKPAHTVELKPYQIGKFPVTNAEYALFIDAGGYQDEQWWDTEDSLAWLHGKHSTDGAKQTWRNTRQMYLGKSDAEVHKIAKRFSLTSQQINDRIIMRDWTDERFEKQLDEWFPAGKIYDQPEFWDDTRFNNPSQPVVGVTWIEARAYCIWLTANVAQEGQRIFRLPSEVEFEAAVRGREGRLFPYVGDFDKNRSNTFESHIRRSTPVGIFDNATPEGAYDLSGNVYTWTTSIYDQEKFPYPYRHEPEREDINATEVRRVLRGGSWYLAPLDYARAVYRLDDDPYFRLNPVGFRLVCVVRPPS